MYFTLLALATFLVFRVLVFPIVGWLLAAGSGWARELGLSACVVGLAWGLDRWWSPTWGIPVAAAGAVALLHRWSAADPAPVTVARTRR